MEFGGKCAVVTGGSSGVGKAIAIRLARRGANVFLIARREEPLKTVVGEMKREADNTAQRFGFFSADVSDPAAVREAAQAAEMECGPPTILINSAGLANPGYFEKLSISGMEAEMNVNYLGSVYMIKQVLDKMIERREGWILNIASLAGLKGIFGYAAYSGSKFAVVGFSRALRIELRQYGIRVSVLCPPDVDTPGFEKENIGKPIETSKISEGSKLMQPDDVARAAVKGLERGSFLIIPGFSGKMFAIANRLAPSLINRFFDRTVDEVRKERGL